MSRVPKRIITWSLAIFLAIVLFFCGIIYYKYASSPEVRYKRELKREIAHLSEDELKLGIIECDTALYQLEEKINSDDTNPEERFEARNAYRSIREARELYIRELQKRE